MDLEQTHIYGASIYINRRMTLGFFQRKYMRKAFKNQYLETSMGECMYTCWGFKDVRREQNPKRGGGIINGGTHIIKFDERARK